MKKLLTVVTGGMLALGLSVSAAQADTVRIATEGAYPPFNYTDASGELLGFDVDVANALCDRMEADCELVAQDWDGIFAGLLQNRYDLIVAAVSITEERREQFLFSDPYARTPLQFIAAEDSGLEISEEGLDGKIIGVQVGTIMSEYVENEWGDIVDVRTYDTQENVNLDLVAGRIDATVVDAVIGEEGFLNTPEGEGYAFIGEAITDQAYIGEGFGVVARPADEDLVDRVNEALAAIIEDGTFDEIASQYFDFDILDE